VGAIAKGRHRGLPLQFHIMGRSLSVLLMILSPLYPFILTFLIQAEIRFQVYSRFFPIFSIFVQLRISSRKVRTPIPDGPFGM